MKTVHLREAKGTFSAIIEAAEQGEATIVTKHGQPAAMIVPIELGRRLYAERQPSFATLLMSIPHDLPLERDHSPVPDVDL